MKTVEDRFWSKVDKDGPVMRIPLSQCWVWTGACFVKRRGYGKISIRNKYQRTHRVAWELTHGPIPKGEGFHGTCVLHACDNPKCVNPAHLRLGTQTENLKEMREKKRDKKGPIRCGPNNNMTKLTEEGVRDIRTSTLSRKELASKYKVSTTAIRYIIIRQNWKHVA